jgi:hypothetical protein
MIEVSSALVTGLWEHMTDHFNTRISDKNTYEMEEVAKALDQMGVLDAERFLREYTTTIGHTIYAPFIVGEDSITSLEAQLRICVHEHQHVVQFDREGAAVFAAGYLLSSSKRAVYEAEAFRCNMEIEFFLSGRILDPGRLAQKLVDYACAPDDILVAEKFLRLSGRSIQLGARVNEASKVAIAWLEAQDV